MFTAKRPAIVRCGCMLARLVTDTTQSGGSSEPEMKAFAVIPRVASATVAVITVTPVAKRPITRRKCAGSISVIHRTDVGYQRTDFRQPCLAGASLTCDMIRSGNLGLR